MSGGLEPSIYDDITAKLETNGGLDEKAYRQFVVMALRDIGRGMVTVRALQKDIDELKTNSILLQMRKHPKVAVPLTIAAGGVFLATVWHLNLLTWLLRLVGIPVP